MKSVSHAFITVTVSLLALMAVTDRSKIRLSIAPIPVAVLSILGVGRGLDNGYQIKEN